MATAWEAETSKRFDAASVPPLTAHRVHTQFSRNETKHVKHILHRFGSGRAHNGFVDTDEETVSIGTIIRKNCLRVNFSHAKSYAAHADFS